MNTTGNQNEEKNSIFYLKLVKFIICLAFNITIVSHGRRACLKRMKTMKYEVISICL